MKGSWVKLQKALVWSGISGLTGGVAFTLATGISLCYPLGSNHQLSWDNTLLIGSAVAESRFFPLLSRFFAEQLEALVILEPAEAHYKRMDTFYSGRFCSALAKLLDQLHDETLFKALDIFGSGSYGREYEVTSHWNERRQLMAAVGKLGAAACMIESAVDRHIVLKARELLEEVLQVDNAALSAYRSALFARTLATEALLMAEDTGKPEDKSAEIRQYVSSSHAYFEDMTDLVERFPLLPREDRYFGLNAIVHSYLAIQNGGTMFVDEREETFAVLRPLLTSSKLSEREVFLARRVIVGHFDIAWPGRDAYLDLLSDVKDINGLLPQYGHYSHLYYPLLKHETMRRVLDSSFVSVPLWTNRDISLARRTRLRGANLTNVAYFKAFKLLASPQNMTELELEEVAQSFDEASLEIAGSDGEMIVSPFQLTWLELWFQPPAPAKFNTKRPIAADFVNLQKDMLLLALDPSFSCNSFSAKYPHLYAASLDGMESDREGMMVFRDLFDALQASNCAMVLKLLPPVVENSGTASALLWLLLCHHRCRSDKEFLLKFDTFVKGLYGETLPPILESRLKASLKDHLKNSETYPSCGILQWFSFGQ